MSKTNYIRHLSQFYLLISEDTNLNSTHVSLYMALFQFWNLNRFKNPFYINRGDVMRLSKIGSKSTYHKCLRDLDKWKYIIYYPSHNPLKGSEIKMYNYGTSSSQVQGQLLEQNSPKIGQVLGQAEVSLINNNKQKESSAKNWMLKAPEMSVLTKSRTNILEQSQKQDNLKISKNKNYNEPL